MRRRCLYGWHKRQLIVLKNYLFLLTRYLPRTSRNEGALSNANIRKALPDAVAIQQAVIHAIEPVLCGDNAQICKQMTIALYRYGVALWREYERLKAMRGVLDYDDLINRTNRLLDQSDAAQWVCETRQWNPTYAY